jgi:putative toxin-antitoxin system antitoxin component (TIGR02293 family)
MVLTEAARRKFRGFAVAEPDVQLSITIKRGLPYAEVKRFSLKSGLAVKRLARVTGIPRSTLDRRKGTKLSPVQSEKVVRLERVFAIAFDVFEDEEVARRWLDTPNPYLEGRTPLEMVENQPGANAVEHLLGQIDHSVY